MNNNNHPGDVMKDENLPLFSADLAVLKNTLGSNIDSGIESWAHDQVRNLPPGDDSFRKAVLNLERLLKDSDIKDRSAIIQSWKQENDID